MPTITVRHIILLTTLSLSLLFLISLRYTGERFSSLTPVSDSTLTSSCDRILAQPLIPVKKSEFKIQLIAAMPGSGSAWSKTAIKLVTGFNVDSAHVYRKESLHDINIATKKRPIYYKTHYPYISNAGEVDTYLNRHPDKVVVVMRNPFDAGFSEYVRELVKNKKRDPLDKWSRNVKYPDISQKVNESDFFADGKPGTSESKSSKAFKYFYRSYLRHYERFHKHWFAVYSGDLKVVFYNDLQKDERLFVDIAEYLGYNYTSRPSRQERITCFIKDSERTKSLKRPKVPVVEQSKEVLRRIFKTRTEESLQVARGFLQQKYPNKTFKAWLK